MSLGPILPGRIPQSLIGSRLKLHLSETQRTLSKLNEQLASGQRLFLPSDDPSAATRTVNLQSLRERVTQYSTNVQTNLSFVNSSEKSLASVSDILNRAKQISSSAFGSTATSGEKEALAAEARSLVQSLMNIGNSQFRGRFLFGGSQSIERPFNLVNDTAVRYEGDRFEIGSLIDNGILHTVNVDGDEAFGALGAVTGTDLNPAATLSTRLRDLHGGLGADPGSIQIALSSPALTKTIDLSTAETLGDVKTRIEDAFGAANVTVAINGTANGLTITPAAGTVAITDVSGGHTALDLQIATTAPVASINSGDLDPLLTDSTSLASLNGGAGIGTTSGKGLRIVNGGTTTVVDISSATTVEDLFNLLRRPDLNVSAGINSRGDGLQIATRLSGVDFSIGENNSNGDPAGFNATSLGIRTLKADTPLADLYHRRGVQVDIGIPLDIERRDGTNTKIDLSGSVTIQHVLDKINAVTNLSARLNHVGNGITITDSSGTNPTGPFKVLENEVSLALALNGSETGTDNTVPYAGRDPNPLEAAGSMNLLLRLEQAIRGANDFELTRIDREISDELSRVALVRGQLFNSQKVLDESQNRHDEQQLQIAESLSVEFDTDVSQAVAELVSMQTSLEATLRASAETLKISLINYL